MNTEIHEWTQNTINKNTKDPRLVWWFCDENRFGKDFATQNLSCCLHQHILTENWKYPKIFSIFSWNHVRLGQIQLCWDSEAKSHISVTGLDLGFDSNDRNIYYWHCLEVRPVSSKRKTFCFDAEHGASWMCDLISLYMKLSTMIDQWWMINDEWSVINDQWLIINDQWWMRSVINDPPTLLWLIHWASFIFYFHSSEVCHVYVALRCCDVI